MSDSPFHLEQRLREPRHAALARLLPDNFVLPRYDGRSIANLPPTIGTLLGVEAGWAAPPLDHDLLDGLGEGVERVVLLLVDGIGWRRMWQVIEEQDPTFRDFLSARGARAMPITSVSPATTSVATTTLWGNGAAPAEHGMIGFSFLLMEQAAVCSLLFWKPIGNESGGYGELERWGLQPETFLPIPSIAQLLAQGAVRTSAITPQAIMSSPLSRMQMRGAEITGYQNPTDLWLSLEQWLEKSAGTRGYCYAYYPDFDTLSHRDSPTHRSWEALWRELRFQLGDFLDRLSPAARGRTLFLLTADHGHVHSPMEQRVLPRDHPELLQHFMLYPGGEPRHNYLYVRPGHRDAVRAYVEQHLADRFHLLGASEALQAGLYGPPHRVHPDAERRIGDFVMLSRGGAMLWTIHPDRMYYGMHGSLEADEMIVPLISMRLDA